MADENAVLSAQGGEVADGSHGGEVEEITEIGVAASGDFLEAMAEFENEGGGAEIGVAAGGFGVDECGAGGRAIFGLVVINDDEIHVAGGEPCGFFV